MAGLDDEAIQRYFVDLGMGGPLVERGMSVVNGVRALLPEPIEHLFVTEYWDDEGNRHYENLWLLTQQYISESQSYLTEDNFDIVPVHLGLARVEVSREHFDFVTSSEQSRLTVNINFSTNSSTGLTGNLKASGANCIVLDGIIRSYLMPLLQAA